MHPIYLDYMATTPVDPRVVEAMVHFLGPQGNFGNPASQHGYGKSAALAVEKARAQIAAAIGAEPQAIIFTSGATEANNLAILGAARFYQRQGRHLITMQTEHKAVLDSFAQLERDGFRVTYLPPEPDGLLNYQVLENSLTNETVMVSIMHVNNETGVIQDITCIGNLLRKRGILFHVDAAQSPGKLPINLQQMPVDLMAFSAHKNYGPKGIGALYIRQKPRIRLYPQSFGGNQEQGLRSGTLATHQIVGMGEAFAISEKNRVQEQTTIGELRNLLWQGVAHLPGIHLNGHQTLRVAGNLNLSFSNIPGDALQLALKDLAVSSSSACLAASFKPSYVLQAMGVNKHLAYNAIRFSLGRFTTKAEIQTTIQIICDKIPPLQHRQEKFHMLC